MTIESTLTDWDAGARQCVIEADQLFPGFSWGTYNGHDPSKGLAADAMVPAWQTAAGRAKGQELADWIWTNRARWGIWYVIFNGRIISQTRPEQGWIHYYDANNPNPSRSHKNHVHVSWKSAPAIPVVWIDRLVPGVTDSDSVRVVQRALGVPSDGAYGPSTVAAAAALQRSLGDAPEHCDGALGPRQTVALLLRSGVRATVRTDPSGSHAPTPVEPVPTDPVPSPPTYPAPTARDVYLDRLREGVNDSDSVWWAQSALTRLGHYTGPLSGAYDAATLTAVKRYQLSLGDDPKHCDGLLGERQTIRLFTDAGMPVTIWRSSVTGDQIWPEPTPKPVSHQITAAYANILRRTDTEPGRKRWPARKTALVSHLKSTKASVIMLCEVDKITAADIASGLGQHWAYYPSGLATERTFSPLAILWDTNVWRREVDAFVREYSDRENRFLQRLPLVHRASGKVVVFYASHLENDGDTTTDGHVARRTEARDWATWSLDQPGIWGADLNSTTRSGAKPTGSSLTAIQREKPRPILREAGWRMLSDQDSVANREYASHHGGKSKTPKGPWIDDMGFRGVTYLGGALVRTDGTDASDHHILRLTAQLKPTH